MVRVLEEGTERSSEVVYPSEEGGVEVLAGGVEAGFGGGPALSFEASEYGASPFSGSTTVLVLEGMGAPRHVPSSWSSTSNGRGSPRSEDGCPV